MKRRVTIMPTVFSVDSGRCDRRSRIKTEMAGGGKIKVTIVSTCPDVRKYAEKMKELSIRDIAKSILENPIYQTASGTVGPECLVPCALVSAAWTEAGMVSKNLLKRYNNMCIRFEDTEELPPLV